MLTAVSKPTKVISVINVTNDKLSEAFGLSPPRFILATISLSDSSLTSKLCSACCVGWTSLWKSISAANLYNHGSGDNPLGARLLHYQTGGAEEKSCRLHRFRSATILINLLSTDTVRRKISLSFMWQFIKHRGKSVSKATLLQYRS